MKKDGLFLLLTCVVLVACVSCLTPLLLWSATNKASVLTVSTFVCSSVGSLVILALLALWNTTRSQDG